MPECYSSVFFHQYFFHSVPHISSVVTVQLETTSFTVEEEMDFVEVCVNISSEQVCPIEFDAGITLSTRRDTAGIM